MKTFRAIGIPGVCLAAWLAGADGARAQQAAAPAAGSALLWVEAESAARQQTHRNAWYDSVDPAELSGGAQIANFSEEKDPEGWAEYDVDAPAAGAWRLWLRANPCSGLRYRLDGGAWTALDADALKAEDQKNRRTRGYAPRIRQTFNVAADGENDARKMSWYDAGTVEMTAGRHVLRFSLGGETAGTKRFAAMDCFVLAQGAFEPNFQYKPGETPKDLLRFDDRPSWAFEPARDTFSPEAAFDLRALNEETAGERGFVRLSDDGNDFVRGDGRPLRFWGGSTYVQRDAHKAGDQGVLEHHARFLAKRGVNVVRLHGAIAAKKEGSAVTDVDEAELDQIYRLVAAMKKAGVYTIVSPYWGSHTKLLKSWGAADPGSDSCAALVFFDPVIQRGYKAWLKRIYADPNPYTGIPLAKDPAVAVIQIQNEDSMLFWTMQRVKGQALLDLRRKYGDWLLAKYGSFEKALAAWGGYAADLLDQPDDFAAGRPGLHMVWELTQQARNQKGGDAGREARLADQCEFMARTMHDFNREIVRYLREDLGCRQLVNAGNWRTADQTILDDAERWSYLATDVVGKNHYFGGLHNGINVGWQILPGQVFTSPSFARNPVGSPLCVRQAVGRPFIIPESLWVPPMEHQAEGPLVVAAQGALTGLDTFYWFATGAAEWQEPLNKWTFAVPTLLGQFPAAALIFRREYVKAGPAAVHEERTLEDIWRRRPPMIAEHGAFDPNRDKGEGPEGSSVRTAVDPLAYLVGRVEVVYGGDPAKSRAIDLAPHIDAGRQAVRSATGEITTDLARGVYLVNAPKAQGAAGFLGAAGAQAFADVTIDCANPYASIVVVPLDDRPIASSSKLLIQAGTVMRPTGWVERAMRIPREGGEAVEGRRIVETGKAPWRVENTKATVVVRNGALSRATALDPNGMPGAEVPVERTPAGLKIVLPPDALYVAVE